MSDRFAGVARGRAVRGSRRLPSTCWKTPKPEKSSSACRVKNLASSPGQGFDRLLGWIDSPCRARENDQVARPNGQVRRQESRGRRRRLNDKSALPGALFFSACRASRVGMMSDERGGPDPVQCEARWVSGPRTPR